MNVNDPSLPNFIRPEVVAVKPDLDLVADLLAGTRRMWERARQASYIRQWADESLNTYQIRSKCETVFEGLARVLSASVGMLFAKPPQIVWNQSETAMVEHWQNLDGMGTAGPVLAKRFSDQSIRDGIGVIFVDHPPSPPLPEGEEAPTGEEEVRLGLRPTWKFYQRAQIENWRTAKVNNKVELVQITFEERDSADDGPYGVKEVIHHRTLRLLPVQGAEGQPTATRVATWELKQETKEGGQNGFKVVGQGVFLNKLGLPSERLPVAVAYTGRTDSVLSATIPLLGVAWANLSHWRLSTALTFAREIAAYAQPVVIGEFAPTGLMDSSGIAVPGKLKIGPLIGIHLVGEGASFKWEAPPVEAFQALETGVLEKEKQIGTMGMSFMISDTRAAETAEAKRLDSTAENSTLATAGQGIEDAWNLGMELHAWYLGIEKAGAPMMTISKDFDNVALDPETMVAYVTAVRDAGLPVRLLLEAWQQGGRIPADTDLDALEAEVMANAAAIADQQAQIAEDQAVSLLSRKVGPTLAA